MTNSSLVGRKYGRLTILEVTGARENGRLRYSCTCRCECGTIKDYRTDALTIGKTKSCGCFNAELAAVRNRRHGGARRVTGRLPEYKVWEGMKRRCFNENEQNYERYGGRGITICERWLGTDGFGNFYADMGPRPSPYHSIDRINNDGNYEPGNCRWATDAQQRANKRPRARLSSAG